jgi:hypothetical protein
VIYEKKKQINLWCFYCHFVYFIVTTSFCMLIIKSILLENRKKKEICDSRGILQKLKKLSTTELEQDI